jgi:hypothetical protein
MADSKNQVIVTAGAFGTGPEAEVFEPGTEQTIENMTGLTGKEKPLGNSLVLGDTGYKPVYVNG